MVEFALVFPVAALLIFGIVVVGITVTHQITLSNAVRVGARAAALCGSSTTTAAVVTSGPGATPTLPDGSYCTPSNVTAYIDRQLALVDPSLAGTETFTVLGSPANPDPNSAPGDCRTGDTLEVSVTYQQPLYLPLLGYVFGNGTTDTRTVTARGEATCEQ